MTTSISITDALEKRCKWLSPKGHLESSVQQETELDAHQSRHCQPQCQAPVTRQCSTQSLARYPSCGGLC